MTRKRKKQIFSYLFVFIDLIFNIAYFCISDKNDFMAAL